MSAVQTRFHIPLSIRACGFPAHGLPMIFWTLLRSLRVADGAGQAVQAVSPTTTTVCTSRFDGGQEGVGPVAVAAFQAVVHEIYAEAARWVLDPTDKIDIVDR